MLDDQRKWKSNAVTRPVARVNVRNMVGSLSDVTLTGGGLWCHMTLDVYWGPSRVGILHIDVCVRVCVRIHSHIYIYIYIYIYICVDFLSICLLAYLLVQCLSFGQSVCLYICLPFQLIVDLYRILSIFCICLLICLTLPVYVCASICQCRDHVTLEEENTGKVHLYVWIWYECHSKDTSHCVRPCHKWQSVSVIDGE